MQTMLVMKDGGPYRVCRLINFLVKWRLKNSSGSKKTTETKTKTFLLSTCAHASGYVCWRTEECRLMAEATEMFFFYTRARIRLENRRASFTYKKFCSVRKTKNARAMSRKEKSGRKNREQAERYLHPQRKSEGPIIFITKRATKFLRYTLDNFVFSSQSLVVCQLSKKKGEWLLHVNSVTFKWVSFFYWVLRVRILEPISFA